METEVSCLRRRLAEEDRCRNKILSAVCVFVCQVIHRGVRGLEGVHGGCGSGAYVSAEVGSLAAITSSNVSDNRFGSKGDTILGPVFLRLQIQ